MLSAAMTSTNYTIYADSFSMSDASVATTSVYTLSGTTGEVGATSTSSTVSGTSYLLRGGFSAAEKGILSASVSASSVSLGTLSTGAVSTGSVTITLSTDSETGYTVAVSEDGNLRSGSNDINDVSDGSVTAGSEEYGIRTTGSDGLLSNDTAVSGSVNAISGFGATTNNQTTLTFRASVGPTSQAGSYSHVATISIMANP